MPVLGITGGIATGKSSFARRLVLRLPGRLFDADTAARELLDSDPHVKEAVCEAFGPGIINPGMQGGIGTNGTTGTGGTGGNIDRARLREIVFREPEMRKRLEGILHPMIRSQWMALAEKARREALWLVLDIPLLYETGAQSLCDIVAVVGCSEATQRERVIQERGLTAEMAERIISSQQTLASKIGRACHLIWSDASKALLDQQAHLFATYLQVRYG